MYAVIMAGGGGTRLHPLSTPERPKPFLPLVDERSLLQHTVDRLAGLSSEITVIVSAGYRDLVAAQVPEVAILTEPTGRNTAAAIALATIAIDRPADEVMLVLPADAWIDPDRDGLYRDVLRSAADHLATGSFGIESPLVTLGTQVMGPATEYGYLIPKLAQREEIDGQVAYPLQAFEEKPRPPRAEELFERTEGVAWNAGMFLWRRRAIRAALERYTGLIQLLEPTIKAPTLLAHAYDQLKPVSIDYAVMEGASQSGEVVMASMAVGWSDLGSWTALLGAIGARGSGAVVQAGETVEVDHADLVVRRVGGRLGVIAPNDRGRMTATQPISVLRGAGPDRALVEALLERCSQPEGGS
jgi:mannose-1-phosphate guanylyltransferase